MRARTFLVILILFALAGGAYWIFHGTAAVPANRELFEFPLDWKAVDRIEVRRGGEMMVVERSGAGDAIEWKITAPKAYPADMRYVMWALGTLGGDNPERTIQPVADPCADMDMYGLDEAEAIRVELSGTRMEAVPEGTAPGSENRVPFTWALLIGGTTEDTEEVYLGRPGLDRVWRTAQIEAAGMRGEKRWPFLKQVFGRGVRGLRDTRMMDFKPGEVVDIRIGRTESEDARAKAEIWPFIFQRQGEGKTLQWWIIKPELERASMNMRSNPEKTIPDWLAGLRAVDIFPDSFQADDPALGLDKPLLRVALGVPNGDGIRQVAALRVGAEVRAEDMKHIIDLDPDQAVHYAAAEGSGAIYAVDERAVQEFKRRVDRYRIYAMPEGVAPADAKTMGLNLGEDLQVIGPGDETVKTMRVFRGNEIPESALARWPGRPAGGQRPAGARLLFARVGDKDRLPTYALDARGIRTWEDSISAFRMPMLMPINPDETGIVMLSGPGLAGKVVLERKGPAAAQATPGADARRTSAWVVEDFSKVLREEDRPVATTGDDDAVRRFLIELAEVQAEPAPGEIFPEERAVRIEVREPWMPKQMPGEIAEVARKGDGQWVGRRTTPWRLTPEKARAQGWKEGVPLPYGKAEDSPERRKVYALTGTLDFDPAVDPARHFKSRLVWPADPARAVRIRLDQAGGKTLSLSRTPGMIWTADVPGMQRVDQEGVGKILGLTRQLRARRLLPRQTPEQLRVLGLDEGRYRLSIRCADAGGKETEASVIIGTKSPDDGGYFARMEDSVFTIGEELVEEIKDPRPGP
jgi:hypothetical protein